MTDHTGKLTRRDFLKGTVGAALGAAVLTSALPGVGEAAAAAEGAKKTAAGRGRARRSRVVLVRDAHLLDGGGKVVPEVIARMLDQGVTTLMKEKDPREAWSQLILPDDRVGIKTNVWRFLRTPKALEAAIRERVKGCGVPEDRIGLGDRDVLEDPRFRKATALVNVRPLRTHHWSGVGSCIKNVIMFSPSPASWHDDACADLAGVWDLPAVKGKVRLNILVMTTPLFHGKGPHHFNAKYTWPYKGLIVGTDPVAVDAVGVRILEAKRKAFFGKDEPFATSTKHIRMAEERFALGVADPARIDLVKLGWGEDAFV